MSAFKCEHCGELFEGTSNCYKTLRYARHGPFEWNNPRLITKLELCSDCAESFEDTITK